MKKIDIEFSFPASRFYINTNFTLLLQGQYSFCSKYEKNYDLLSDPCIHGPVL